MDDIWDEDAPVPSNVKKVEREHGDAGYLDGVTKAKIQSNQPGFDEGYIEGADIGLLVGRIIGTFQALGLSELESMALKELSPRELFCSTYYNEEARPLFSGNQHPLVVKWQKQLELYLQ